MDLGSVVGFLLAWVFVAIGVFLGGGTLGTFVDVPSIVVTIGGAVATVMVMFPLRTLMRIPLVCKAVFVNTPTDIQSLIKLLVSLSETARRDGLLALENRIEEIDDDFLVLGMQMIIDGTQPQLVETVLRSQMEALNSRHRDGKAFFDQLGKMAPAFGMIGTLLGLIMMLGALNDPDALGPGMAVAMITTLYGSLIANVLCIPFAEKLSYYNRQELHTMEIALRGMLSIRDGDSPRAMEQKLSAFIATNKAA